MASSGGKRQENASSPHAYDPKLERVARALDEIARVDETIAASDRRQLPVAIKGRDEGGEVQFPLQPTDLMATSTSDAPSHGGLPDAPRSVDAALSEYFGMTPVPLAKKFKIASDVSRIINAFAADRHFVYIVDGYSFEKLTGDERKIAQSLAAFCAQSGGQFVLFFAGVLCSQERTGDRKVTLKTPWLKYGEFTAYKYPPIDVRVNQDVGQVGRVEQQELYANDYGLDEADFKIVERRHENHWQIAVGHMRALVVQPAMVEQLQMAKMEISYGVVRLRSLFSGSRDDALQYARQIVRCRPEWILDHKEMKSLQSFVEAVIKLDDRALFLDLLQSVCLDHPDPTGCLRVAVDHFSWDACIDTIVARLLTTATLRSRVHLVNAIVDASSSAARINELLTPLLSLHPWTTISVSRIGREYEPNATDFARLLSVARASSREMLTQLVSMTHAETFIRVVVPALPLFLNDEEIQSQQSIALHVSELFQAMAAVVRNKPFVTVRLPANHCETCDKVQSFLTSKQMETVMHHASVVQHRDHIAAMLRSRVAFPAMVELELAGATALRLTKSVGFQMDDVFLPMQRAETVLHTIVALEHLHQSC